MPQQLLFSQKPEDWARTIAQLEEAICSCTNRLQPAEKLSRNIIERLSEVSPILEELCRQTCPDCLDCCCHRATVWYDRRDLLVIRLATGAFPAGPVITRPHKPCNLFTESGCRIERRLRPFICTWYLCPTQKKLLVNEKLPGSAATDLNAALTAIKEKRKKVERCYLEVLAAIQKPAAPGQSGSR